MKLGAAVHRPLVGALLGTTHRWWPFLAAASCSPHACAATRVCGKDVTPSPPRFPPPSNSSPSLSRLGDYTATLHPKSSLPSTRLAPRPLHRRPPPAGRLDFASRPPVPMGAKTSLVFASGRKAEMGWAHPDPNGPSHCRSSPSAQCRFIISTRIDSFQIQIWFKPLEIVGN
jgi:hypothetical protein